MLKSVVNMLDSIGAHKNVNNHSSKRISLSIISPKPIKNLSADFCDISRVDIGYLTILKALWVSDVFIVCGGTMFHDGYPKSRHKKYRLVLLKLMLLIVFARILGSKVGLIGIGLGRFTRPFTKFVTAISLWAAHEVVVRDENSLKDGVDLIGENKVTLGGDLAHLSLQTSLTSSRFENRMIENQDEIWLLLSLVPPKLISTSSPYEAMEFAANLEEELKKWLDADKRHRIECLSLNNGRHDSDYQYMHAFYSRLEARHQGRVHFHAFNGDQGEIFDRCIRADIILAMRFHLVLCGYMSRRTTFALPYQRKVSDLAHSLDFPEHQIIYPCGKQAAKQLSKQLKYHEVLNEQNLYSSRILERIEILNNVNFFALQGLLRSVFVEEMYQEEKARIYQKRLRA